MTQLIIIATAKTLADDIILSRGINSVETSETKN